jgi:hypothetical protein
MATPGEESKRRDAERGDSVGLRGALASLRHSIPRDQHSEDGKEPQAVTNPSGVNEGSASVLTRALLVTTVIPLAGVVAYAAAGRFPGAKFLSVLGIGLLISTAAGILGVLIGFLFALPRTTVGSTPTGPLSTNTNLDQVSDWLTKILIGLGLVQIGRVGSGLDSLAETVAPGLGGTGDAKTVALCLLVYSLIEGFLIGYLGTRIVVAIRLKQVEDALALKQEVLGTRLEAPPTLPPPPPGAAPPTVG